VRIDQPKAHRRVTKIFRCSESIREHHEHARLESTFTIPLCSVQILSLEIANSHIEAAEGFRSHAVGSRTGAVFRRSSLAIAPRFLWECLSSQTVNPFPAPPHRTQRADFPLWAHLFA
jgi:hypothetical protein